MHLFMADRIILSPPERRELTRMSRSRGGRLEDVRRARVVLELASGAAGLREIARGNLGLQNPARPDFPRHLHFQGRPAPEDHALHPTLQ